MSELQHRIERELNKIEFSTVPDKAVGALRAVLEEHPTTDGTAVSYPPGDRFCLTCGYCPCDTVRVIADALGVTDD